jgi:hypothetical protein
MFAGECPSRAEVGGLFRLPLVFLAAFLPPEEAVGRRVVVLKSFDRSLWLYQAQAGKPNSMLLANSSMPSRTVY